MQDVSEHLFYRTPLDDCFYFTIVAGFIFCNYILLVTFKKWEVISRLKNSSIYLKDFEDFDLFFFTFFLFFHFLWEMPVYLVSYAKRMLYSVVSVLLARKHLGRMILNNFENLNSIWNLFQETHELLILTDPVIICIYLRTTVRLFRDQGNARHLSSKILRCDLVQMLNTFWNHFLRIFATGKASLA